MSEATASDSARESKESKSGSRISNDVASSFTAASPPSSRGHASKEDATTVYSIKNSDTDVTEDTEALRNGGQRQDEHLARWLPIISGLFCPFSVLLDIPGLTERWYVRTIGYNVVETQPNPRILDAGLAISLILGVIANAALVGRFLERNVVLTTWVAILALTVHDVINIIALVTFGVIHRFNDGFTYGQAYWQTTAATVASLTCNITLLVDYFRTTNFRRNGSGLTSKQRSLVIAVMALLGWIALGSLCFTYLFSPNLSFIDSMYFVVITTTTVGFGDIVPATVGGRVFSFIYDPIAIIMLGFCIAVSRETIIESFEASYRHRRELLARKARERKEERRRRMQQRIERRENELKEMSEKTGVPVNEMGTRLSTIKQLEEHDKATRIERRKSHVLLRATKTKRELDYMCEVEGGMSVPRATLRYYLRRLGLLRSLPHDHTNRDLRLEPTLTQASVSSNDSFKSFRQQLRAEQRKELRMKLGFSFMLFLMFWFVGAAVFSTTENWTYFEGMWFCFVFFSTIGYGDFTPKSSGGRSFFLFWALFGIGTMTVLLSVLTESWTTRYHAMIVESKVRRTIKRVEERRGSAGSTTKAKSITATLNDDREGATERRAPPRASELADQLVKTARDFDHHARFFMTGRTGEPPERLRELTTAADEFEEEIVQLHEQGEIDMTSQNDVQHFLFMMSYQKAMESLIDTAESFASMAKEHNNEIRTMKELNDHLRCAIHETRRYTRPATAKQLGSSSSAGSRSHASNGGDENDEEEVEEERTVLVERNEKRPPGGFGDELAERELEHEIDSDEEKDGDEVERVAKERREHNGNQEEHGPLTPMRLLERSSSILKRHTKLLTDMSHQYNTPTSSSPVEHGDRRPSAADVALKRTLTFEEPSKTR